MFLALRRVLYTFRVRIVRVREGIGVVAATWGDERTDVPVSVAELCRRLGPVPSTADSLATGRRRCSSATCCAARAVRRCPRTPRPGIRGSLRFFRGRAGRGRVTIPFPRRRGEACKTALGAGGLVVAGSVLGAALLAAAGVGGPLPSGQLDDDGTGQFQGEGTLVRPGTAYGSVSGRDVVHRSGLLGHRLLHPVAGEHARIPGRRRTGRGGAQGAVRRRPPPRCRAGRNAGRCSRRAGRGHPEWARRRSARPAGGGAGPVVPTW